MLRSNLILLIVLAALLVSCEEYTGPVIDPSGSSCSSGVAQIGVGDGFLEYLCGCTGAPAPGTILDQPANLTCHVPPGTQVYFQYIAIQAEHQIVNSSGLFFVSGAPTTPLNATPTVATFTGVGTYGFQDSYNLSLQGQIIVP